MINWREEFPSGSLSWVLMMTVIPVVFISAGYFLVFSGLITPTRRLELLRTLPLLISALILGWGMWGYTIAFGPSWGTVPQPGGASDPMNGRKDFGEWLKMHEAMVDETDQQGRGGFIGGLEYLALHQMNPTQGLENLVFPVRRPQYHWPHPMHLVYRALSLFVVIVPLWITWVRRYSLRCVGLCSLLWMTMVFAPVSHWCAGDGWLESLGTVDFGGGLLFVAVGGSVLSFLSLPLREPDQKVVHPEPFRQSIGTLSLCLGATLYVVSHTFKADGRATLTLMNMALGLSSGLLMWSACNVFLWQHHATERMEWGAMSLIAALSGGVGFLFPQSVMILGLVAGVIGNLLDRWSRRYSLPEWGMVMSLAGGGAVGLLGTGILLTNIAAGQRWDGREILGLIQGHPRQVIDQLIGVASVFAWSVVTCWILRIGLTKMSTLMPEMIPVESSSEMSNESV